MKITCKVCGKAIRGNAASESYDETAQEMRYTCRTCAKVFEQVSR